MRRWWWLVLGPSLLVLPHSIGAQYSRPSGAFTLDRISEPVARQIRTELASATPRWDRVLLLFFGADGYDRGIADLVVHIPREGAAKLALVHEGRVVDNLRGQSFLYFIVFSERAIPSSAAGAAQLALSTRSIETAKDPFLTAVVNALAARQRASAPEPELEAGENAALQLALRDVRADTSAAERLDVAMGRVRLGMNTLNRVTISGAHGFDLDPNVSLHYMFGNSDGSRFGASIGPGLTLNVRRPVFDGGTVTGTEGYLRSSLYMFAHVYIVRPNLPRDHFGLGVALGTNVMRGELLNDLVLGLSVGRVAGIGAVVGVNSVEWLEQAPGSDRLDATRRFRAFIGLDYRL